VVLRNNVIHQVTPSTIQYFTDTEGGSSGSPVCDDQWRVMALHRAWKRVVSVTFQGKKTAYVNEGTPLPAIVADLGAKWTENVSSRRG
jgi:V8-like Glu-specific endopeptidase